MRSFFIPPNARTVCARPAYGSTDNPSARAATTPAGLGHKGLDSVLVAQPVTAGNGVVCVFLESVVLARDGRRATLCGDGVAAHRVHLGDDRHTQARIRFGDRDRGAQTATAADTTMLYDAVIAVAQTSNASCSPQRSSLNTLPSCRIVRMRTICRGRHGGSHDICRSI